MSNELITLAFSPIFVVPAFVIAYLLAPFIISYIPYKRRGDGNTKQDFILWGSNLQATRFSLSPLWEWVAEGRGRGKSKPALLPRQPTRLDAIRGAELADRFGQIARRLGWLHQPSIVEAFRMTLG